MRSIFTITILFALCAALAAQQPDARPDATPSAESEIKALELRLPELIVQADWDEYAKHLASDFLHTRDNGQVENKEETMAALRDLKRKIIVMEMEPADLLIHTYGDTAVASAKFTIRVREAGQVKSRVTRQTDVFVKRDGQWLMVAEQVTDIGK
ncbi:MAG: nuclear transport factor 2 family protein [Terriglobales bacterium]|jgi:ketosteroid isomerase-like protein